MAERRPCKPEVQVRFLPWALLMPTQLRKKPMLLTILIVYLVVGVAYTYDVATRTTDVEFADALITVGMLLGATLIWPVVLLFRSLEIYRRW